MAAETQSPGAEKILTEKLESSAAEGDSGTPGAAARDRPVCLIVLGMAGSGKTTFVQVRGRMRPTAANVS